MEPMDPTDTVQPDLKDLVRIEDVSFYMDDPFPVYARLRREQPVFYYEPLDIFVLSRGEDIRWASRHPEIFSSSQGLMLSHLRLPSALGVDIRSAFFDPEGEAFFFTDPPRHRQLRRIVSPAFSPVGVATLEDDVRAAARGLVDMIEPGKPVEYVTEIAARLPVLVQARLLGVPSDDFEQIRVWTEALETISGGMISLTAEEIAEAARTFATMKGFFREQFDVKRRHPGEDLISTLVRAELDGEPLSEARMLNYCLIFMGSTDTTRALLSGLAFGLATNPDQLAALVADRSLMKGAVEEGLRWTTPARGFIRTVMQDTEIRGQAIRAGQHVYLLDVSANYDDEVYPEPQRFDITRGPDLAHMSFGFGVHTCIAAPMVRMETAVFFNEILDRYPSFEVAGRPRRVAQIVRQGWEELPLRFFAAGDPAVSAAGTASPAGSLS
jgi:cytochrome P450